MLICNERYWRMVEEIAIERDIVAIVVIGRGIFQIALVLRQNRLAILYEAEGRLQLSAHCEQFGRRLEALRQGDWRRRKAARAPQYTRLLVHYSDHRVVYSDGDLSVMNERVFRNSTQPFLSIRVIDHLGLIGQMAAGHHHRPV